MAYSVRKLRDPALERSTRDRCKDLVMSSTPKLGCQDTQRPAKSTRSLLSQADAAVIPILRDRGLMFRSGETYDLMYRMLI